MRETFPDLAPWTLGFALFTDTLCITPMAMLDGVFTRDAGHALFFWIAVAAGVHVGGMLTGLAFARAQRDGTLPPALRRTVSALQGGVLLMGAPLMLGAWTSLVQATTLPSTPRLVIALAMTVAVVYSLAQGLEAVGRVSSLIGVASLPILFIIVTLMGVKARIGLLNPLALLPPAPWVLPGLLFSPRGYVLLGAFAGPKVLAGSSRPLLIPSLLGVVFLAACLLAPPVILGWPMARGLTFPFFYATGTVTSPFLPFQRVEFLVNIIWQLIVLGVATTFLTSALRSFGGPVRPNAYDWRILAMAAFVFAATLPHLTVQTMADIFSAWSTAGLIAFLVMPAAALAAFRVPAVRAA